MHCVSRSTIVHSKNQSEMISYREEHNRDKEKEKKIIPQRIPKARPGKVVGPGKDAYDPRLMIRNPIMQQQVQYSSSSSSLQKKHIGKTEGSQRDSSRENYHSQVSHHHTKKMQTERTPSQYYMPNDNRLGMNTTMIPSAGSLHN